MYQVPFVSTMSFRLFIAKRYMLSKKEAGFITVISAISVIGITVGVAALIVVLSVFNGFNGLVTQILVGFDPHVRVTAKSEAAQIPGKLVIDPKEVQGIAPFVSGKAMIVSHSQSKVVFVRGLESSGIEKVCGLKGKMILGTMDLHENGGRNLILGLTLADRLGVVPDDSVWLVSPAGSEQALLGFGAPVMRSFRVAGIYESDNRDYDLLYTYMSLHSAQQLFQMGEKINGYEIRLFDIGRAETVKAQLQAAVGNSFQCKAGTISQRSLFGNAYRAMDGLHYSLSHCRRCDVQPSGLVDDVGSCKDARYRHPESDGCNE